MKEFDTIRPEYICYISMIISINTLCGFAPLVYLKLYGCLISNCIIVVTFRHGSVELNLIVCSWSEHSCGYYINGCYLEVPYCIRSHYQDVYIHKLLSYDSNLAPSNMFLPG